nr:HpcH/HpaI aldolase/citrate lyase family protein [Klebsiella pneumoniae subsp. pneumoniae]
MATYGGQFTLTLKVSPGEHSDALRILNSTQAVFKSQGAMCEPATHRRWAQGIWDGDRYTV